MSVIDVRVAYHVHKFANFQTAHLSEHVKKDRILHHVPVVCGESVLTALIENAVELVARNVEGHGIGARVEMHLVQVLKVVDIGENTAGTRIVFQVEKHSVHLVEFAFGVYALDAELIAVRFADRTGFVSPTVPDMGVEIVNVVALFLPYPQYFVNSRFECGAAKCDYGEFF